MNELLCVLDGEPSEPAVLGSAVLEEPVCRAAGRGRWVSPKLYLVQCLCSLTLGRVVWV